MMGRKPLELSADQKREVETLAAVLTAEQVADYLGVGRTTFFAMMNRDAEIAERYKKGKARAIGAIAQSLIGKARSGNVAAMIFFLKTQAGWRETTHVEHVGLDESLLVVEDARDRLRQLLGRHAERQLPGATDP